MDCDRGWFVQVPALFQTVSNGALLDGCELQAIRHSQAKNITEVKEFLLWCPERKTQHQHWNRTALGFFMSSVCRRLLELNTIFTVPFALFWPPLTPRGKYQGIKQLNSLLCSPAIHFLCQSAVRQLIRAEQHKNCDAERANPPVAAEGELQGWVVICGFWATMDLLNVEQSSLMLFITYYEHIIPLI